MRPLAARGLRVVLWIAAWSVAAALLWLAVRGVDWRGAAAAARDARAAWIAAAMVANLAILLLWAALWLLLLPRDAVVRYARMFGIASVTSAIMNTIPALVGHASAVALLVTRGGLPVRTAGAVLTLDQLGEGLSKLAVLAIALTVVPLPSWMTSAALGIAMAVTGLLAATAIVARFGGVNIGEGRLKRVLDGVRRDLHVLRSPARAAGALGIALAMKAAEAAAIACVIVALDVDVPRSAAVVVLAAVNLATMLPVSPGNVGTYEAGAVAAYRWMGASPEAAFAAAIVQHLCFLVPAVIPGVAIGAGALADAARGRTGQPARG